ncbi:MAG TPA: polyphosphate kinase 1 [Phycisphaerales bacterium]|nr:polyphosphate kinase 1 [Phycisphaerales bacterium]
MTKARTAPALILDEHPGVRYFNRDLSWLAFNRRVLAQAADERTPLLERARFMAIFTSNLDEFFMKRVGLLKRQVQLGVNLPGPDGRTPRQALADVREEVGALIEEQARIFERELRPALGGNGLTITRYSELSPKERGAADDWFMRHVFPALTPLAVNPTHRFPFISNLSNNLGVMIEPPVGHASTQMAMAAAHLAGLAVDRNGRGHEAAFARVKIPTVMGHFLRLADRGAGELLSFRFIPLQDIVRGHLGTLFPGMTILDRVTFRVTRSAGIQKDDLDTANLLQSIEADLKARRFARVARLEIEEGADPAFVRWLLDKLNADPQDVYERPGGLDLLGLAEIADVDRPDLKHRPWKPVIPPRLAGVGSGERGSANFFATLRKQDILLHHPYESFNASVERFIAAAANDPDVLTIKQTLYRTTPDSPFIENLVRAAEAGKQVACLVEIRARFDEDRNVRFARQLERAGVHVAYGVMGLKTHCKTSLVVRKERQGLRCYAHLGTGNYHPKTAQLYTDLGLLTCDEEITGDLVRLFNYLTGVGAHPGCETLLVAPFTMRPRLYQLMDREMEMAKKGRPARIWAKLNALEDREVTERLYAASQAGVDVRLVVRGFCCLIPGVRGLSENIRVSSVVGRFLEHSRVYHFGAGNEDPADGDWYIGSADWMYRNLSNRVEVACPVRDADARRRILGMFDVHAADHRNAWDLLPDGRYLLRAAPPDAPADSPMVMGTFESLMREADNAGRRRL